MEVFVVKYVEMFQVFDDVGSSLVGGLVFVPGRVVGVEVSAYQEIREVCYCCEVRYIVQWAVSGCMVWYV